MSILKLKFSKPLNVSAQVGDTLYYTDPTIVDNTDFLQSDSSLTDIGTIREINNEENYTEVVCNWNSNLTKPSVDSFILFSKDNRVNVGHLKGYYGKVIFENKSGVPSELYSSFCEVSESSK
tara:strand:- start:2846 stop:3211 length:366 start_codon:yes stop_codon:yes gene_type:complete